MASVESSELKAVALVSPKGTKVTVPSTDVAGYKARGYKAAGRGGQADAEAAKAGETK